MSSTPSTVAQSPKNSMAHSPMDSMVHSPENSMVNISMDSMVHSPIEVSSISPDQLHITPIATIDQGRERSVEDFFGDDNPDVVLHEKQPATRVRLLPLGPAAPIDKMSQVHFRFPKNDNFVILFKNTFLSGQMEQYLTASSAVLSQSRNTKEDAAMRTWPLWRRRRRRRRGKLGEQNVKEDEEEKKAVMTFIIKINYS